MFENIDKQLAELKEEFYKLSDDKEKIDDLLNAAMLLISAKVAMELKKQIDEDPNFIDQFKG